MMRMTVLASGSKGNSTVISSSRTRVLVDAGQVTDPPAAAAVAALSAWLGATAVRSDYVATVRRAIDMAGAIRAVGPIPGCALP